MTSSLLPNPAELLEPASPDGDSALRALPSERLRDSFGRAITDLRVSVTDRCNFRCVYCRTGNDGAQYSELPHADYLRMIRLFVSLGIEKVRLTGGEPLLRAGLVDMVRELSELRPAFADSASDRLDIALTTNGHLLAGLAQPLKDAGLSRITVSMDAVDPETFAAITRVPRSFDRVLAGIRAAAAAGLGPVKVNCVLLRGFNDAQIEAFAEFSRREGRHRPLHRVDAARRSLRRTRRAHLEPRSGRHAGRDRRPPQRFYRPLVELPPNAASETARRYTFADGMGEIGIIAPVSRPFCGHCSRIRLTSDGKIRTCLFSQTDHDLAGRCSAAHPTRSLRRTSGVWFCARKRATISASPASRNRRARWSISAADPFWFSPATSALDRVLTPVMCGIVWVQPKTDSAGVSSPVKQRRQFEVIESRQMDHLRVFHDVARTLTTSLELEEILLAIMDKMANFFGPERWSLLMIDPAAKDLYYAIAVGEDSASLRGLRVPLGQGVAGWVAATGNPLVVPNVSLDPHWSHLRAQSSGPQHPLHRLRAHPLRREDAGRHPAAQLQARPAQRVQHLVPAHPVRLRRDRDPERAFGHADPGAHHHRRLHRPVQRAPPVHHAG